ncbi:Vps51/Vps67-domain-containing protein [Plectosphaerella plurivora]|uniref:Vacuolar protein sorting-associated protein 51 homolog n=1 Tax=Plectosphaerella plurivora TaxID=936078 RepID=A0A9P8VAL0_9PEZI|nr:Vps51/Vps67-domain-containing protein [Plectosphaerella plurivora]
MSTIASPRDPSAAPLSRRISNQPLTPTGSNRPSLDLPRSATTSPGPSTPTLQVAAAFPQTKRANRAALREYYNLKKQQAATPTLEVTQHSEVSASEIDVADFDAEAYVTKALEGSSLEELLRIYARVLGEVRALDAEKKALVYDNYSKLISATETIRKMRANMDPLNPMASTLDPAIAQIYSQASAIRDSLRQSVPAPDSEETTQKEALEKKRRAKKLAREVLDTPERLRKLAAEGKMLEARRQWELPRRLLESWRAKGVGGKDVLECLAEGDAAVGRVPSPSIGTESSRSSRDE